MIENKNKSEIQCTIMDIRILIANERKSEARRERATGIRRLD